MKTDTCRNCKYHARKHFRLICEPSGDGTFGDAWCNAWEGKDSLPERIGRWIRRIVKRIIKNV